MRNIEYYTKPTGNNGLETQCSEDLLAGKIKITDVPYKYRNHHEYIVAHIFARTIADDMERHHEYWKIAFQLESDVIQSEKENDKEKEDDLMHTYETLFKFTAHNFT